MDRASFIAVVRHALREVPSPFREQLKQVDIVVKRRPTAEDLLQAGLPPGESMYGFYRGIPLTGRGAHDSMVLPDVIDIYQEPLEEDFPEVVGGVRVATGEYLIHLVSHFAFHLGQLDYHRRVVTGQTRGVDAVRAAELSTARPAPD